MEIEASNDAKSHKKSISYRIPITPSEFNLEAYAIRYDGYTKLLRLLFIAENDANLKLEACQLLREQAKVFKNLNIFQRASLEIKNILGEEQIANFDDSIQSSLHLEREKKDMEFTKAKTSMVKDSIRCALNELGEFYYLTGIPHEALKHYSKSRDYCVTPAQNIEMCLNVAIITNDICDFRQMATYLAKAEAFAYNDRVTATKLQIASALHALHSAQYEIAARKFLDIDLDIGNQFNRMISNIDVALYGIVLGFYSLNRIELKKIFEEQKKFKRYIDLIPKARYLIQDFFSGEYKRFLEQMRGYLTLLRLDIHLGKHAAVFMDKMVEKIVVQYFSPYNIVDLSRMSSALGIPLDELEDLLFHLISDNILQARVDCVTQTLRRKKTENRKLAASEVLHLTTSYNREVKRSMLFLSLQKNNLSVRSVDPTEPTYLTLGARSGSINLPGHRDTSGLEEAPSRSDGEDQPDEDDVMQVVGDVGEESI